VAYRKRRHCDGTAEQRLAAIGAVLEPEADRILEQCEAHQATANRNYYRSSRKPIHISDPHFFNSWRALSLVSTSADLSAINAIRFLLDHKASRQEKLAIRSVDETSATPGAALDLSLVAESWWPLVV
jgi:hypothetical protein